MIEAIAVSLIAVLFAFMARNNKGDIWLKLSMFTLTVFLSIGYNWGSDVSSYNEFFNIINSYGGSLFDYSVGGAFYEKGEYGWVILNRLCSGIGFWGLRIVLFCFENFVIYRLIKHYVSKDYYWMAVFFYTFNNSLMVLGSSMMRQFLAMCIIALAMDYLIQYRASHQEKKVNLWSSFVYVIAVMFASLFHRSALFALPAFMIVYFNYNFTRKSILPLILIALVWFSFGYLVVLSSTSALMTDYFESYSGEYETISGSIGVGVIFNLLLYILIYSRFDHLTKEQKFVCVFSSISVMIMPFVTVYEYVTRIALYFSLFSIVVYPIFFKSVAKNDLKYLIIPLIILTLYGYWGFFHNPLWAKAYQYTTIFSVGGWQ